MTKPAALCAILLALAACDTTEQGPGDEVLGMWAVVGAIEETVVIVSEGQEVVDLSLPATGSLSLSGGATGTLRFVQEYNSDSEGSTLTLASHDPEVRPYPAPRHVLVVTVEAGRSSVLLERVLDTGYSSYYANDAPGMGVARTGARYTLDTEVAITSGPDAPVRVAGALTLGHRTLLAGVAGTVAESVFDFSDGPADRYTFRSGGALRYQNAGGATWGGTWTRTGSRIALTPTYETVPRVYDVRREGEDLLLTTERQDSPCDAACTIQAEEAYRIAPGTLQSLRTVQTLRLTPVPE